MANANSREMLSTGSVEKRGEKGLKRRFYVQNVDKWKRIYTPDFQGFYRTQKKKEGLLSTSFPQSVDNVMLIGKNVDFEIHNVDNPYFVFLRKNL